MSDKERPEPNDPKDPPIRPFDTPTDPPPPADPNPGDVDRPTK